MACSGAAPSAHKAQHEVRSACPSRVARPDGSLSERSRGTHRGDVGGHPFWPCRDDPKAITGLDNRKLAEPRAFALNDEALLNMAYAAYKKTRDVGVRIAAAFYGRAPAKMYFFGGSEGGREALVMAQRFPNDFDGVVSVVPVVNYTGANLMRASLARVQTDGGWISPPKFKLIHNGVIAACESCMKVFDVGTLRCPGGTDTGDTCLSDAQIEADRLVRRPFAYPVPLKHGITAFPGWN